jgi:uncharacterized repeat protein (TIGR01451 family)
VANAFLDILPIAEDATMTLRVIPTAMTRTAMAVASALAILAGSAPARQAPAPQPTPAADPGVRLTPPPGSAVVGAPLLPPEVQVVRFSAPEGAKIEILGPATEGIVAPDASDGGVTVGLKVGVSYRLKLSNLHNAPGVELFPMVELVGHLHRAPGVDPLKFPIRVPFTEDDLEDAAVRGRMVTQVVYLESPDQALPLALPKNQISVVTLSPVESPMKIAPALGRPMAIVRVGGRAPTVEELSGAADFPMDARSCPFASAEGGRCGVPCGAASCLPAPTNRPWMPKDEFLCDGGDGGTPASFGSLADVRGVEPRDAVVRFQTDERPRVLPTNRVCMYAPRFAAVRASVGANQNKTVVNLVENDLTQQQNTINAKQGPKKFTQNQMAELARHRSRASNLRSRQYAGEKAEIRVLGGYDVPTHVAGHVEVRTLEIAQQKQKGNVIRVKLKADGIKTVEAAVVTGLVQGGGQLVMSWKPQEVAGVEVPPNKPGLMVLKQVDASEAEPGDVVTYTIRYRNMGNVAIRSVSILDSLLPRLEYVPQSALGPAGTVFTSRANDAGSTELRWDLPEAVAPGQEGYVLFRAKVR